MRVSATYLSSFWATIIVRLDRPIEIDRDLGVARMRELLHRANDPRDPLDAFE